MSKKDGQQKGAQLHPEGGHGEKTRQRIIQQLHSHANGEVEVRPRQDTGTHPEKHRLTQDREQHDEAEKNSEKTRLARDVQRQRTNGDPEHTPDRGPRRK